MFEGVTRDYKLPQRGGGREDGRPREGSLLSEKPLRESGTSPAHYTWSGSICLRRPVSCSDWSHPATNTAIKSKSGQIRSFYTV